MAEDSRDFIEQVQSRCLNYHGKELSVDELATEFAKFGIDERVAALEQIAASENGAEYTPKQAADAYADRHALRSMHERLRKVGR